MLGPLGRLWSRARSGVHEPRLGKEAVEPDLLLVPLLAFDRTAAGSVTARTL